MEGEGQVKTLYHIRLGGVTFLFWLQVVPSRLKSRRRSFLSFSGPLGHWAGNGPTRSAVGAPELVRGAKVIPQAQKIGDGQETAAPKQRSLIGHVDEQQQQNHNEKYKKKKTRC